MSLVSPAAKVNESSEGLGPRMPTADAGWSARRAISSRQEREEARIRMRMGFKKRV
jgi:hypothetical protein